MVEVYKTNVQQADQAEKLVCLLQEKYPAGRINFDLEDCDRILRVQHDAINTPEISGLLHDYGFVCEPLPD